MEINNGNNGNNRPIMEKDRLRDPILFLTVFVTFLP